MPDINPPSLEESCFSSEERKQRSEEGSLASTADVKRSGDAIECTRKLLASVLASDTTFQHSARASFLQFDADKNKLLDFDETRAFFAQLCFNLTIPPISDNTLKVIFEKYDSKGRDGLSINDFTRMYKALLLRIRNKYYPPRIEDIRSTLWVPMSPLGRSIDIREFMAFERRIGSGVFGEVHEVIDLRTQARRACKIINKAMLNLPVEQVEEEINILKNVDHPNVIKIFEIFEDPNSVYILQELCRGGELLNTLLVSPKRAKNHDEAFVRHIMKELFEGLCHIHGKRIVHKDLKPGNVMFATEDDDSPIKIIDFGLGEIFKDSTDVTQTLRGSAIYMAPEAFKDGVLCLKSDVWSAGCIMYNLLTGKFAFDAPDIHTFRRVVVTKELDLNSLLPQFSPEARDLLQRIFHKRPEKRISAAEALRHKWFDSGTKLSRDNLSESMCLNMRNYAKQSNLRNVFVNLMAQQLSISNEHVKRITRIFKELDTEGKGHLTHAAIHEALKRAKFAEWDINLIIQQLDVRNESQISYTEFLAACYSWRESELNLVWAAFQRINRNGTNQVTRAELKQILIHHSAATPASLGGSAAVSLSKSGLIAPSDEDLVDQMIDSVDRDKDGIISWNDFEAFIRGK